MLAEVNLCCELNVEEDKSSCVYCFDAIVKSAVEISGKQWLTFSSSEKS